MKTVYRVHLTTEKVITISTEVDIVNQVRTEGTWVDTGRGGYVNPAHIVWIEVSE